MPKRKNGEKSFIESATEAMFFFCKMLDSLFMIQKRYCNIIKSYKKCSKLYRIKSRF